MIPEIMKISIVSAVYHGEPFIEELTHQLDHILSKMAVDFEIIYVDDRSPDDAWVKINKVAAANTKIKGIRFSKNYGQHRAISAGLNYADGDYVILVDCDMQDATEYIPDLIQEAMRGNDIVFARKSSRQFSKIRNFATEIYFKLYNLLTDGEPVDSTIGTFSVLSKKAVQAYRRFKDNDRHYVLIVKLLGFKTSYVLLPHRKRKIGKSSYSLRRLIHHAIDGITSQSTRLLRYMLILGVMVLVFVVIFGFYLVLNYYRFGSVPSGYTSLAILLIFSMAINITMFGVSGIYIGKTFEQVKGRPMYIVDESINLVADREF